MEMLAVLIFLVALNVCDFCMTCKALALGAKEINPLIRWAIPKFGVAKSILLNKFLSVIWIVLFWIFLPNYFPLLLVILTMIYTYITIDNESQLDEMTNG
jgi:hypothetical protein